MKALSYIFLFYVGFYFYRLAEIHKRNKWLFGLLGIVVYFASTVLYLLYLRFFLEENLEELDMIKVTFKSFLIGLTSVVIVFQILSFIWSRKDKKYKSKVEEIGK